MDHLFNNKKKSGRGPTLPPGMGSTIGAAGCHGRVRDGNGWSPGAWPACSKIQNVKNPNDHTPSPVIVAEALAKETFDVEIAERPVRSSWLLYCSLLRFGARPKRSCKPYKRKPVALLVRLG